MLPHSPLALRAQGVAGYARLGGGGGGAVDQL